MGDGRVLGVSMLSTMSERACRDSNLADQTTGVLRVLGVLEDLQCIDQRRRIRWRASKYTYFVATGEC